MDNHMDTLLRSIKEWFDSNGLTDAVVGFSGGIDSAVTAALCQEAGIPTTLVRAVLNGQTFSSSHSTEAFASQFGMLCRTYHFNMDDELTNAGKEAALPIVRVSYFYAVAAQLRDLGRKPCVVGTINFDEASFLGFWGKSSDAAQDFYPISHLHKSEVYKLAHQLDIPETIINATPSGDLQFSGNLNDLKMIGASYDVIEAIAKNALDPTLLSHTILSSDDVHTLKDNVLRNAFKYKQPLPGVHLVPRLEEFRRNA